MNTIKLVLAVAAVICGIVSLAWPDKRLSAVGVILVGIGLLA